MYRSDDSGATWNSIANIVTPGGGQNTRPMSCHCPYDGNEAGNIVYVCTSGGTGFPGLWKSTNSGASWGSRVITTAPSFSARRFCAETWTQNNQRGFYWTSAPALVTTDSAFSSTATATGTGLVGTVVYASGGFPYNNSQFYAVTGSGIYVSTDRGETWVDKTGDWLSGFVLTLPEVIVPVWVAE
jgi:hypothetical protein